MASGPRRTSPAGVAKYDCHDFARVVIPRSAVEPGSNIPIGPGCVIEGGLFCLYAAALNLGCPAQYSLRAHLCLPQRHDFAVHTASPHADVTRDRSTGDNGEAAHYCDMTLCHRPQYIRRRQKVVSTRAVRVTMLCRGRVETVRERMMSPRQNDVEEV